MATIVTRSGKGAALTHTEVDANFTNLNTDKAEVSAVILATQKGAASGVAPLDATSKILSTYLPSYVDDVLEYANYAALPATGETGKIYVALDTNKTYRWSGSAYVYITSGAVDSVAGKTGVVTLAKADVGLSNVDNTTDALKPISTATQTALDLKAPLASPTFTGTLNAANLAYTGTLTGGTGVVAIGTDQIYKDASGNVGLGTTGPKGKLHVIGMPAALPATTGTTPTGLNLRLQNNDTGGVLDIGSNGAGGAWLQVTNATNLTYGYPLLLNPNGGNVGIGTSSFDTFGGKLTVASAASTQSTVAIWNPGQGLAHLGFASSGSNLKLYNCYTTGTLASGAGIDIDSSGKVGIGYAIPANTLHVANGVDTQIRVSTPTNNFYFDMGRASADGLFQINGNQGSGYKWLNNGTEAMRISAAGYVGIGTTSPGSIGKLTVSNIATTDNSRIGVVATAYLSTPTYTGTFLTQGDTATTGTVCGLPNANLGTLLFQNVSAGLIYTNSQPLIFGTAAVEALRINTTQDVSIPAGQLNITNANNTATGGGQIYLSGATGNRIDFSTNGVAAPAFTTRSVGTKIVLYPNISASLSDFALGMESNALWTSVPATTAVFKWYGGTTLAATLLGTGDLNLVGNMGVGGATASTSGSGITFPATPSASSDANTLDDYKEGVWTPVLTSGFTTTGTVTRAGYYTKVGRVVTVNFLIQATSVSPANAAVMSGLPFPATQYGIGLSTNVGGTATAMSITVSGSTLIFGGVSIFTPNLSGSITYIAS